MTPQQRSFTMSRIRSRGNVSTEQKMIQIFRLYSITGWRRNYPLPGKPDFVFRISRLAVFIDGCFWHGCPECQLVPKTNQDYWYEKIHRNKLRDKAVNKELKRRGWRVVRFWEHAMKHPEKVASRMMRIIRSIGGGL
ncbi:MAG: very short patch repair endonuclease [Methylococcales bacterium]|nr:very short patch repair endonuclease [Methylococcales bacterium]